MKKALLALIPALILTACSPAPFIAEELVPTEAVVFKTHPIDFDGDLQDEQVIHYSMMTEIVPETVFFPIDYMPIFRYDGESWNQIFDFVFPEFTGYELNKFTNRTKKSPRAIVTVFTTDILEDGKQELLILLESDFVYYDYLIFEEQNGEIKEIEFTKGKDYINENIIDFYGKQIGVEVAEGKIIEHWGKICEGGINPCYTFDLEITRDPETLEFTNQKASNIMKINHEYDAYLERYSDATPWTGELPF